MMYQHTHKVLPAAVLLSVSFIITSPAQAETINETLGNNIGADDVYSVECDPGTDSARANVVETAESAAIPDIVDNNTLFVHISYDDIRGCFGRGGDPSDAKSDFPNGGAASPYAVADCGPGDYTVRIMKTHAGFEKYQTRIFCRDEGVNEAPGAITLFPDE